MRRTFWYIIGGQLATISIPAVGQEPPASPAPEAMAKSMDDTDNSAVVSAWPDERQTAFATWPEVTQDYFWSLTPERQELFWRLGDDDKVSLAAMDEPERAAAWEMIEQRVRALPGQPEGEPDQPATNPEPGGR